MNRALIIRLSLVVFALILLLMGWKKVKGDDGMTLMYFMGLGLIAGFLVVKYVLPWLGDTLGTIIFSSGEKVQATGNAKAAAKLAQGDYKGAIAEHEKSLEKDPLQSFSVAEIAKIYADRLEDPASALKILLQQLAAHPWSTDDAAFLSFRLVDLHAHHFKDYTAARQTLEKIMMDFPNTRHSANARHRLNEVEQMEFKRIQDQRNAAGRSSSI